MAYFRVALGLRFSSDRIYLGLSFVASTFRRFDKNSIYYSCICYFVRYVRFACVFLTGNERCSLNNFCICLLYVWTRSFVLIFLSESSVVLPNVCLLNIDEDSIIFSRYLFRPVLARYFLILPKISLARKKRIVESYRDVTLLMMYHSLSRSVASNLISRLPSGLSRLGRNGRSACASWRFTEYARLTFST